MESGLAATLPLEGIHTLTSVDAWSCVYREGGGHGAGVGGRSVSWRPRRAGLNRKEQLQSPVGVTQHTLVHGRSESVNAANPQQSAFLKKRPKLQTGFRNFPLNFCLHLLLSFYISEEGVMN